MKKLSIIPLVLYLLCSLNVNATETECFWGRKTPWQKMTTVLYAHGVDTTGMGVTTLVNADILNEAALDLAKTFGVKSELNGTYTKQELIGDVICHFMQLKYTKQTEKHAYFRVRYSTDEDDYARFIMSYPNSRYADEMQWKMNCLKAYWSWFEAMTEDACRLAYLHSKIVDNYFYEGFVSEYRDIVLYIQTVDDWELLMQARAENKYADCDAFTRFRRAHEGHLTGYNFFINDSILNCEHNQAWKAAKETNTIAAYRDYLSSYPAGEHTYEVKRKIRDFEDWSNARDNDNYAAYAKYVEQHPYGDSIARCKEIMQAIKNQEWHGIKDSKDWKAVKRFCSKYGENSQDSTNSAYQLLRKLEEPEWKRAKRINTWESLSNFQDKYPYGYYYNEADEMKYNILSRNQKADITTDAFIAIGQCSSPDSSVVMIGNISGSNRMYRITIKRDGGDSKYYQVATMGETAIFRMPNGRYRVMIECAGVESHYGNILVSGNVYGALFSIIKSGKDIWGRDYNTNDASNKAQDKVNATMVRIRDTEQRRYDSREDKRNETRFRNAFSY